MMSHPEACTILTRMEVRLHETRHNLCELERSLLDRAETVFTDLARIDQRAPQALRHLIAIYQAERDWRKAIENATRYEAVTGEPMGRLIAQFECELADRHRAAGEIDAARDALARAYAAPRSAPSNAPRATIRSSCPNCCRCCWPVTRGPATARGRVRSLAKWPSTIAASRRYWRSPAWWRKNRVSGRRAPTWPSS